MKKGLIIICAIIILSGCDSKKESITKPEEISYTNNFECYRNEKISKIYDFNKEGNKLLVFYEIHTYEYVIDIYNIDKEKSSYSCGEYEEYGFKSCEITTTKNSIIMTKVADINSDYNKDMVSKMTLESIKSDYAQGDMYTCN